MNERKKKEQFHSLRACDFYGKGSVMRSNTHGQKTKYFILAGKALKIYHKWHIIMVCVNVPRQ